MKSPAVLLMTFGLILAASFSLTSCESTGGSGDAEYTPPPSLSPVDATEKIQSDFRNFR